MTLHRSYIEEMHTTLSNSHKAKVTLTIPTIPGTKFCTKSCSGLDTNDTHIIEAKAMKSTEVQTLGKLHMRDTAN